MFNISDWILGDRCLTHWGKQKAPRSSSATMLLSHRAHCEEALPCLTGKRKVMFPHNCKWLSDAHEMAIELWALGGQRRTYFLPGVGKALLCVAFSIHMIIRVCFKKIKSDPFRVLDCISDFYFTYILAFHAAIMPTAPARQCLWQCKGCQWIWQKSPYFSVWHWCLKGPTLASLSTAWAFLCISCIYVQTAVWTQDASDFLQAPLCPEQFLLLKHQHNFYFLLRVSLHSTNTQEPQRSIFYNVKSVFSHH